MSFLLRDFQTSLIQSVLSVSAGEDPRVNALAQKLVRKHSTGLGIADFSVPLDKDIWIRCCAKVGLVLDENGLDLDQLFNLNYVASVKKTDKVFLFQMSRSELFSAGIKDILLLLDRRYQGESSSSVLVKNREVLRLERSSLSSQLRCHQVVCFLRKLLQRSDTDADQKKVVIHVGCSDAEHLGRGCGGDAIIPIQVGPVTGGPTSKKKRLGDHLVQDLYDPVFKKYLEIGTERESADLGPEQLLRNVHAAAAADLALQMLSTSVGTSCTISLDSALASTILYNYARIVHIFRAYEITDGYPSDLPGLDEIDFSLLKEPEEWELLFNYVLPYKELLESLVQDLIRDRECRIQRLVQHLSGLATAFSRYYNRIHILKDPSRGGPQLMSTMFARIQLLRALRSVIQDSFQLLDIEPLNNM